MCVNNTNRHGEHIIERRTLMMGALGAMFNTGCSSVRPSSDVPHGLIYTETIQSLATTEDWRTLVIVGRWFNYLLPLDEQLMALLRGDLRPRLAADFGTAHLHPDDRLELPVRLSVLTTDLTDAERARFVDTAPTLPGRRVLFDEKISLKKFRKSELEIRSIGQSAPNAHYQIDVMGSFDQSPLFVRRKPDPPKKVTMQSLLLVIPFSIVLLFNGGVPLK